MNKIRYMLIFTIISLSLYAQKDNCDFGFEAQKHVERGSELIDLLDRQEGRVYQGTIHGTLLQIADELEKVLKYNPRCEIILLQLAEIYTRIGNMQSTDIRYYSYYDIKNNKTEVYAVNSYFSKAISYLERAIKFSNDLSVVRQANTALNKSYSDKNKFNASINESIKALIIENEIRKNTQGYLSLGFGYGAIFGQPGQMGLRASLFSMSMRGVGIVGGIGYPQDYYFNNFDSNIYSKDGTGKYQTGTMPILWYAGGGYSVGTYKWNVQLLAIYGKIQTREMFYENTGGLTLATNIKLFSDLALNADVGYWLSDTSDIAAVFGFSVGLCYRFRFN